MKIDIHTHTRKVKSGDALTREISADDFCDKILSTDVGIVAITNHNLFDLTQYSRICESLKTGAQAWPGVELDILDGESRGHLLVIASPSQAEAFASAVASLTAKAKPDAFAATIEDVLSAFEPLAPLYVAHYRQKKPNISDAALDRLITGTKHPQRVIREVSNSISAGIYISHGHASIYGSDVHDWAEYDTISQQLPDLRLPVDSFEQFCLLLEKDPTTINTALNKKTVEELVLQPFEDEQFLKLRVFNDINVLFGAKGTGKSCILTAIAKYYSEAGLTAEVYVPGSDRLDAIFDIKGKDLTVNLDPHGIAYCSDEIELLRKAREQDVTSVPKYVAFFASKTTNRNAKRLRLKDVEPVEEGSVKRSFLDANEASTNTASYLDFVKGSQVSEEVLGAAEFGDLLTLLSSLLQGLQARTWASYVAWKEACLLNSAVALVRKEVERKTGSPAKPTTTGLRAYASNRIQIAANSAAIVGSLDTPIPTLSETVGSLGPSKGVLTLQTEFVFQNGKVTEGELSPLRGIKKSSLKTFAKEVRTIAARAFGDDLFQHIAALNDIDDVEEIETVYETLLFRRYFALNGQQYEPSSGEASMVMLQAELERDADVYLLDEPERSLGNEYISDVIVPLIRERARAGKRVFISTHDANIAVRTLPYSSIYRAHDHKGYRTYVGNPFTNKLINTENATDHLDWRNVSMRTLEGGRDAFGERGRIYGDS